MKFALIALVATVAAEQKTLALGGVAPSPADAKTIEPTKTDPKAKKSGVTTESWTKTNKNGTTSFDATFDKENKTMSSQMRKTWEDYFMYAFKSKGMPEKDADGVVYPSCATAQECNEGGKKSQCCVNTVLHHKATGTKDINYRCMTKAVIDSNVDMKLGDFEVKMNCVGSGAQSLTLGVAAVLVAASLY
jgi:hypothetical protein